MNTHIQIKENLCQRGDKHICQKLACTHNPVLPPHMRKEHHPIRTCQCAMGNTASLPSSIQGDLLTYDRSGSQLVPPAAQSSSLIVAMPPLLFQLLLQCLAPIHGPANTVFTGPDHLFLPLCLSLAARLPVCVLDIGSTFDAHTKQSPSSNVKCFPRVQAQASEGL